MSPEPRLAEEKRIGDMLAQVGLRTGSAWSGIYEDKDDAKSGNSLCDIQPAKLIKFRTSQWPENLAEEIEKQLGDGEDPYSILPSEDISHLRREWAGTSKRPAIILVAFPENGANVWLCIASQQ